MAISLARNTVIDIQRLIDRMTYPPTHDYEVETLTPRGPLKDRVKIIEEMAPGFFTGEAFLDIGCSKGFFLHRMQAPTKVGLDPDPEAIKICRALGLNVVHVPFEGFMSLKRFDRIFVGNCYHYLFRDEQWRWIDKLAALSTDLVLIEGPTEHCPDLMEDIRGFFYEKDFLAAMGHSFRLLGRAPSCSYTPERFLWVFQKKDLLHDLPHDRYKEYLAKVYPKMASFIGPGTVVEVCCREEDRGTITPQYIKNRLILVDKDPKRPGLNMDVTQEIPAADYLISTALLHHLGRDEWAGFFRLAAESIRKKLIFTGPSQDWVGLIGDHKSALEPAVIQGLCSPWKLKHFERIGMTEPYCEWLIVLEK